MILNDYGILEGWHTEERAQFIRSLLDKGAPLEGVGIQYHVVKQKYVVPIPYLADRLRKVVDTGLPITITELSLDKRAFSDEASRAEYMYDLMTLFYGTKQIDGVYLWHFDDTLGRTKDGADKGLLNNDFTPTLTGQAYDGLVHGEWKTHVAVEADAKGEIHFNGIPGKYLITDQNGENPDLEVEFS